MGTSRAPPRASCHASILPKALQQPCKNGKHIPIEKMRKPRVREGKGLPRPPSLLDTLPLEDVSNRQDPHVACKALCDPVSISFSSHTGLSPLPRSHQASFQSQALRVFRALPLSPPLPLAIPVIHQKCPEASLTPGLGWEPHLTPHSDLSLAFRALFTTIIVICVNLC